MIYLSDCRSTRLSSSIGWGSSDSGGREEELCEFSHLLTWHVSNEVFHECWFWYTETNVCGMQSGGPDYENCFLNFITFNLRITKELVLLAVFLTNGQKYFQ